MKPSILFIVTGDFEALKKKGNERMIYERDEGGFFDKVITVHPISYKTRSYILNNHFEIYDIGLDLIQNPRHNRFLMYLQTPIHFFRVVWKTVRLIKKYRIDLIRATDPYWMGLFGYICSKICRVPFCVSIHVDYDLIMETNKNLTFCSVFGSYKLARLLERFILSRAHMIMPYTETLVNQTIAHGAKKNKIRHFLYASTSSVYGNNKKHPLKEDFAASHPMSVYAATKRSNELIAHSYSSLYNLPTTGLRFFTVYGPWGRPDMALFKFTKNIIKGKKIDVYNKGNHSRSFTYIDDIVDAIELLLKKYINKNNYYEILNIGGEKSVNLMNFINIIESKLALKADINFLPKQLGDVEKTESDCSKIASLVNYKPKVCIEEGISNFIDWYKEYYL